MPDFERFDFNRARGVVWVCDLVGSSKFLNDNRTADSLEQFIPRLYWIASIAVEAAGGKFIKWTGDGFLAWFETPLHRDLGEKSFAAFEAAWHLTLLVNVTQLNIPTQRKFKLRHGITYEHDALLTSISHLDGHKSLDITGRAVVLAFRLSGIESSFPSIVTQRELVDASNGFAAFPIDFKRWNLNQADKLRYFKGESWGINSIYASGERRYKKRSTSAVLAAGAKAIAAAEGKVPPKYKATEFANRFSAGLLNGPDWCKAVTDEWARYLSDELLGALKDAMKLLSDSKDSRSKVK